MGNIKKRVNLKEAGFRSKAIKMSHGSIISPGDVIYFIYPKLPDKGPIQPLPVLALVVSNARTGSGATFISTKNNKLLSCFDISESPPEVLKVVLDILYKNSNKCNYSVIKNLKHVFGPNRYRTHNTFKITQLHEVFLDE